MAIIRIKHCNFEQSHDAINISEARLDEWGGDDARIKEPAWEMRYQYEATLILQCITGNNYKSILEIGSGQGRLSEIIQEKCSSELQYHLIDKPCAKQYFDEHKSNGTFFVQDLSTDLDTTNLLSKYDLIICNDTLEHLYAPSNIVRKCYHLMHDNSIFFVSVPNWRMAHQFVYRGLWDYDNFLYFMYIHKMDPIDVYPSPLQTPHYPKLDSEETMPNELLQSWNFYFEFKKRK